jgi:hypothetical protein
MAIVPIFTGRVTEDGRLELAADEARYRRDHLRSLAGRDVEVIVRKRRVKRSNPQNKYLHAVVFPLIADEMCDSVEGVKFDLMGERFGWTETKGSGRAIPVRPHTSEMTEEECSDFIDWVIPWAAVTLGILVPPPRKAEAA